MERMPIHSESDILVVLAAIRRMLKGSAFSEVDMQKVLVSVSELTRNVLDHANGDGEITWYYLSERASFVSMPPEENGIVVEVADRGQGIPDWQKFINEVTPCNGSKGLGLGLSGTKRLMDEFTLDTSEKGTKVVAVKYCSIRG